MQINTVERVSTRLPQDYSCTDHKYFPTQKTVSPFNTTDNSTFPKDKAVNSVNPFDQKTMNPVEAYTKARFDMLKYLKTDFSKSEKFKEIFGKDAKYDDIADSIIYRIELNRDKKVESEQYQNKTYAFKVQLSGLTGEIVLDRKTGDIRKISVEE